MLVYSLLIVIVVLSGALIGCICLLSRAGAVINQYESFYDATTKSIEQHYLHITNLLRNNVILQGDDSVKALHRSVQSIQSLLSGYYAAGKDLVSRKS